MMSLICSSNLGWLISHPQYISMIYTNTNGPHIKMKKNLFEINVSYSKKSKTKKNSKNLKQSEKEETADHIEVEHIRGNYEKMYLEFLAHFCTVIENNNNEDALQLSHQIYEETEKHLPSNTDGRNVGPNLLKILNGSTYIFPMNCRFYCGDVINLLDDLSNDKFDLILLDPPWWNKYIRRKRKKTSHAYNMMYNHQLRELELENLLNENGLIVVWCTNSSQHINALKKDIFPKWNVEYISKWYWLKITKEGKPICDFSVPPGKQPFEQIIFGCKVNRTYENPPNERIILSVPSALHSHKPPLVELLQSYLPSNPKCLEVFARYLLPNWTSYGNEVLKFQHESLYDIS